MRTRWLLLFAAVVLVMAGIVTPSVLRPKAAAAARSARAANRAPVWDTGPGLTPGHAVVYAATRREEGGELAWEGIWWRRGQADGEPRLVYQPSHRDAWRFPGTLGFLLSPGGRRVYAWDSGRHVTIGLPAGRQVRIGPHGPAPGSLPYWLDEDRLLFDNGRERAVFDTRSGERVECSPSTRSGGPRASRAGLGTGRAPPGEGYIETYYPRQTERAAPALSKLAGPLGLVDAPRPSVHGHLSIPAQYLLRPMGLVNVSGASALAEEISLAISPDGRYIARSGVLVAGTRMAPSGGVPARLIPRTTYAAKVDVYDLRSGRRLWGTSLPSESGLVSGPGRAQRLRAPEPHIRLLRWSPDGRYLSFTVWHKSTQRTEVCIVDGSTWQEALVIGNAMNAFVVPVAPPESEAADNQRHR